MGEGVFHGVRADEDQPVVGRGRGQSLPGGGAGGRGDLDEWQGDRTAVRGLDGMAQAGGLACRSRHQDLQAAQIAGPGGFHSVLVEPLQDAGRASIEQVVGERGTQRIGIGGRSGDVAADDLAAVHLAHQSA